MDGVINIEAFKITNQTILLRGQFVISYFRVFEKNLFEIEYKQNKKN